MAKFKSYTLRRGDVGQTVAQVQGYLKANQDAVFGPITERLVTEHQKARGLIVDGIAGPQTLGSMGLDVLPGLDVSHWQRVIDWQKVAKTGARFVSIKATEGRTWTDPRWAENIEGARAHGLIAGAYHKARPETDANLEKPEEDAIAEADHFLSTYNAKPGDLLPMLDLEKGFGPNDTYNALWALAFLRKVDKELGWAFVYSARWAVNLYLQKAPEELRQELATFPVWWASYNKGVSPKRYPHKIWKAYDVWQYTPKGKVDGISENVDLNWMAGGALEGLRIC